MIIEKELLDKELQQLEINKMAVEKQKEEINRLKIALENGKMLYKNSQKPIIENIDQSLKGSRTKSKKIEVLTLDDFGTPLNQPGEGDKVFCFPPGNEYLTLIPASNDFGDTLVLTMNSTEPQNDVNPFFSKSSDPNQESQFSKLNDNTKTNPPETSQSISFFGEFIDDSPKVKTTNDNVSSISFFGDFSTSNETNPTTGSINFFDNNQEKSNPPETKETISFFGDFIEPEKPKSKTENIYKDQENNFFDQPKETPQEDQSGFFDFGTKNESNEKTDNNNSQSPFTWMDSNENNTNSNDQFSFFQSPENNTDEKSEEESDS